MSQQPMITPHMIGRLSVTGEPVLLPAHPGWIFTMDELIRITSGSDWRSWLYLTPEAAARIARQLNDARPWETGQSFVRPVSHAEVPPLPRRLRLSAAPPRAGSASGEATSGDDLVRRAMELLPVPVAATR